MLLSMFLNKQGYSLVLPECDSRIQKWYQGVIKYIGAHGSSRTLHAVCPGVLDFPGHSWASPATRIIQGPELLANLLQTDDLITA